MRLLRLIIILVFICISATACSRTAQPVPQVTDSDLKNDVNRTKTKTPVKIDFTYCTTDDGVDLTMDFYPAKVGTPPYPAIVYIHGGGWTAGDKSDGIGLYFKEKLVESGYVFISINYRLAPKYSFPDPIEDVKCAIRYLRANANEYKIDPQRIGVMGGSAGGQLAALLGTSDKKDGWDAGQYMEESSRVQAVVDMFGPSDIPLQVSTTERVPLVLKIFNASSLDDPVLKKYSPITYVTSDDPPFLLLHGDHDTTIKPIQSQLLFDKLKSAGIPVELIIVKNAEHSFLPVEGEIEPSLQELAKIVNSFFDQYLK